MPRNKDQSQSIVVRIPKLYSEDHPECLCWFEAGVIFIESCVDDGEVTTCNVWEFEERLNVLKNYILDEGFKKLACGKAAAHTFLENAYKLVRQAKQQLHVGMPIEQISETEKDRKPVTKQLGFVRGKYDHLLKAKNYPAGFRKSSSGLFVPTH